MKQFARKTVAVISAYWLFACAGIAAPAGATANTDPRPASVKFEEAYDLLTKADEARDAGMQAAAVQLYRQALGSYVSLSQRYPGWQPGVVRFRIVYCDNQFETLFTKIEGRKPKSRVRPVVPDNSRRAQAPAARTTAKINSKKLAGPIDRDLGMIEDPRVEEPDLQEIKAAARLLLSNGDSEQAAVFLKRGLNFDPDNVALRLLLGMTQCLARKYAQAMQLANEVIDEDPLNESAHVVLATAYFGLGRHADAKEELERALDINPDIEEAHYNLAQILLGTPPIDLEGARYHYKKALDLGATPDGDLNFLLR